MIVARWRCEEWCEHCLHPIDVNEAVTEAFKLVGEIERKVYFHDRCFDRANPAYFDALKRYSEEALKSPIKASSMPAMPRAARSRAGRPRKLRRKTRLD